MQKISVVSSGKMFISVDQYILTCVTSSVPFQLISTPIIKMSPVNVEPCFWCISFFALTATSNTDTFQISFCTHSPLADYNSPFLLYLSDTECSSPELVEGCSAFRGVPFRANCLSGCEMSILFYAFKNICWCKYFWKTYICMNPFFKLI